ncbi:MAG: NAD(P)-dependent oxidoreductase [Desulfuromonadales bacterium]|nr:NAD(P)-dependent oxidoreductase [Desulfuromonadales bacterium]
MNDETRHLLDADALAKMLPGAILVNIGRGSVVDEQAVAGALNDSRLAGYAADVFAFEDKAIARRPETIPAELLAQRDRTLFTPHLGSAVDSARRGIALVAARDILLRLCSGRSFRESRPL